MFVCQNHGVRSGLFFSQLENRDVFVSCTVRNNAVELTVSAFLELNDVDKLHPKTKVTILKEAGKKTKK